MPELPEVRTIVGQLSQKTRAKKIVEVRVLRGKSFKGDPQKIKGLRVKKVKRIAKILVFEFEKEWPKVLCHLKLTGQLIISNIKNQKLKIHIKNQKEQEKKSPFDVDGLPNKYTRVIIKFSDGSCLYFNDLRVFGWLKVVEDEKEMKKELKNFSGVDPLSREFTPNYFREVLSNWGRPVKLLLMEQKKIAGVGNIYANEALFCAGIAPHHRGRELMKEHPEKVRKLYDCIKKVLQMGLKYKGSTGGDEAYRQTTGERGRMQEHLKVYQKAGQPCPNGCGKKIRRMTLGGRGTFFCPRCQR